MKTFDYAAAWREVARPAYQALPQNVRDLLAQVAIEADDLGQLPDLSMPWPDNPQLGAKGTPGSTLRESFVKIPAEFLALAAHAIYFCGHWFPSGGDLTLPGRQQGSHWKFAHYADQSLRARLIAATSADIMRSNGPFQVHEGAIRLCYSSRNMWTGTEVAPATLRGLEYARGLHHELYAALPLDPPRLTDASREKRDSAAYAFFEALKLRDLDWPEYWRGFVNIGDRYMREEQEIKAAQPPTAEDRAEVIRACDDTIRKATRQRDGYLWLIDHGFHTDNVIYYDHENHGEGVFCFGWRELVTDAIRDQILAVISEFPFAYRIKCADKRVLEGGIG